MVVEFDSKEDLSHYFKIIYRIIKTIDQSDFDDQDKFKYIKILRSQISENEMIAIYYNSFSYHGRESRTLILKYNFLKHLSCVSKVEFNSFTKMEISSDQYFSEKYPKTRVDAFLHKFTHELKILFNFFLNQLAKEINSDDFDSLTQSWKLPMIDIYTISLISSEYNELKIEIEHSSIEDKMNELEINFIASLHRMKFVRFFEYFLYDTFFFSRYIDVESRSSDLLSCNDSVHRLLFVVRSDRKLAVNADID